MPIQNIRIYYYNIESSRFISPSLTTSINDVSREGILVLYGDKGRLNDVLRDGIVIMSDEVRVELIGCVTCEFNS